ncbi:neprilysin-2-like [Copidosoma floridanum]|uniref:neprilysin-2-like n=1 Tax=Copidosoma floridanum TaxID=29053 RepID=UPI0006C94F35|nr:neprilysin-2-like [Copidosoma floridanum]
MTSSVEQIVKNLKWWKRRSVVERGLTLTFTIGFMLVVNNVENCEALHIVKLADEETLPHTTAILKETTRKKMSHVHHKRPWKKPEICYSPECVHTASSVLKNMDPTIHPCDDFYKFACGGFLKNTMIPDDKTEVHFASIIIDKLQQQLRASVEEESKPDDPRPFKLLKTYYQNCMNKTHIEEEGMDPLHRNLKELGGWPVLMINSWVEGNWSWKDTTYKLRNKGYSINYFINIRIDSDYKNSSKNIIYLDQATLGVSREYLSRGLRDKIVKAYFNYMVDIAQILGADRDYAAEQLKESLEFEIKLANISLPSEKRRNITALYNPMTIAELSKKFPSIPWMEYFNTILAPTTSVTEDEVVVVNVPTFITELEKLLMKTPKRVLANYLMWRVAGSSVSYLNDEMRKRQFEFFKTYEGKTEHEPRWKVCVHSVSTRFSTSVGALYVRKYFNGNAKKSVVHMVSDIRTQIIRILRRIDWMDNKTREAALDKAKSMTTHIAYPDELLDDKKLEKFYEKLEISSGSYLQNILNLTRFSEMNTFETLRKTVNKSSWIDHSRSAIVNAFYSPTKNSMQNLNGMKTQGENIADNGGIKLAYLAYKKWVRRNGPEAHLPGLNYTGRQMFWLSAANTWCSKFRPEKLKLRITTRVHSPPEFRVLGPMSNMPEFSKDFNCPLGTKMNPKDKCAVW